MEPTIRELPEELLKPRVPELRCICRRPRSRGTAYRPGEPAQCELWIPPVDIPLGFGQIGRPPVTR
jgi:hypothetical protein